MSRLAGSPYVLDYHDLDHPDRPVFVATTPEGERYDTAPLRQASPGGEIEWLWPGIIPLHRVTLIEGPAGSGKSQLALDLAARASRSAAWPNGAPSSLPEAHVLVVCRRDEAEIVSARFERAGGDPQKLFQFREFETRLADSPARGTRPIVFPYDYVALEQLVENNAFGVIIIDSLVDFCPTPKLFDQTLVLLEELASRANAAILVTVPAHCRIDAQGRLKATSRWPTESVRSAWCLVHDPDDSWRRLFVAKRTNYCREPDGLAFRLADGGVTWDARSRIANRSGRSAGAVSRQRYVLVADLLGEGPLLPASTVFRLGGELGFTPKVLGAAGARLGVTSDRVGFSGKGHWSWTLPGPRVEGECGAEADLAERCRSLEVDGEINGVPCDWQSAPRNLLMERELAQQTARTEGRTETGEVWERMIVETFVDPDVPPAGDGDLHKKPPPMMIRNARQKREEPHWHGDAGQG